MNISNLYTKAESIGMLQWEDEVKCLWSFISSISPHNIMEIGSDRGGNFYALSQLATGKKISLDMYDNGITGHINGMPALSFNNFSNNIYRIIDDSHKKSTLEEVKKILNGEKLDFLFIDGDHSYDGVKLDYSMYKDLVKDGGWIGFHDINSSDFHKYQKCQVDILWKELTGHKLEITINDQSGGIGLIKVKNMSALKMRGSYELIAGLETFASWIKKDSIMVEIGSYVGESAETFLNSGNVRVLFCIDPWLPGYDDSDIASRSNMNEVEKSFDFTMHKYNNYVKIKKTSSEAVKMFPDHFFDLVYIDGNHQYEAVLEDLKNWIPKIKPGGWCTGHDFWPEDINMGVTKALYEVFGTMPWAAFEDRSWIYKI